MAGLACARVLRRAGFYVEIFEKDRIIGGRMGTIRANMTTFDHGAQYITARSSQFRSYIEELKNAGYVEPWNPRAVMGTGEDLLAVNGSAVAAAVHGQANNWYVGVPGMSSIVRPLAESVRIHTNARAHTIGRRDGGWHIWFDDQSTTGPFAAVAIAVPAPQAQLLLGPLDELAAPMQRVRMSPCWALMVNLEEAILPEQDVYSDMSEVIRWVARNNTKPRRSCRSGETVVIHASQQFSRETEDADPDEIAQELWAEVSHVLSLPKTTPKNMSAHLWRHGLVDQSLGETYIFSSEHNVGVAGDWCVGRLAEHAFQSGQGLGRAIVASLL